MSDVVVLTVGFFVTISVIWLGQAMQRLASALEAQESLNERRERRERRLRDARAGGWTVITYGGGDPDPQEGVERKPYTKCGELPDE